MSYPTGNTLYILWCICTKSWMLVFVLVKFNFSFVTMILNFMILCLIIRVLYSLHLKSHFQSNFTLWVGLILFFQQQRFVNVQTRTVVGLYIKHDVTPMTFFFSFLFLSLVPSVSNSGHLFNEFTRVQVFKTVDLSSYQPTVGNVRSFESDFIRI